LIAASAAPGSEQMVYDRHFHLADDRQVVLHQQVVVAMDAAADRVLDWQHAVMRGPLLDSGKHLFEAFTWDERRVAADQPRCRLAERARLSLIGDLHDVLTLHHRGTDCRYLFLCGGELFLRVLVRQKGPSSFSG